MLITELKQRIFSNDSWWRGVNIKKTIQLKPGSKTDK